MADDFLHRPLGIGDQQERIAPARRFGRAIGVGVLIVATVGGVLVWRFDRTPPDVGGVVATIEPAKPTPVPTGPPTATVLADAGDEVQNGIRIVRPAGTSVPGPAFIKVPQDLAVSLQHAPDLRLVEKTRLGLLPQRGQDGSRPAEVYARPVVTDAGLAANAPRIAILVGGMGLNSTLTSAAAAALPAAVTLGFAPYGDDLDRQVQASRDAGHEAVLQVPMEGFGDPAAANMSHLLATGLEQRDLLDRLHWQMSRFTGYVAIETFLGGKFTADATALTPVLRETSQRGLFFIEDGTSPRSLVASLAPGLGLPLVRADVVIDASAEAGAIDAALGRLETRARERGFAVGVASGLPATVSRIAAFSQKLADRGVALVPVSAMAAGQTLTTAGQPRP